MKKLSLVLLTTLALSACQHEDSGWRGFYYPSGFTETVETESFESEAACETWGSEKVGTSTSEGEHASCGFNCTYDDEGQYSCEL